MSLGERLADIVQRLNTENGRPNFENAVADAFRFLDFQVDPVIETQGESDLIVKAPLPQKPYFVIVECSAAKQKKFVSYKKLGQIRGNAPKYFLQYGKDFPTYYKVVVGRPAFSENTKKHALDDVVLLTTKVLIRLLLVHSIYQFSQDELRSIFETKGEVSMERVRELSTPYLKNLRVHALVFMALLEEPTSDPDKRKREGLPIQTLVGSVMSLSWFLGVKDVTPSDIVRAITELSSPLKNVIQVSQDDRLMLTSIPFDVAIEKLGRQGTPFRGIMSGFQDKTKLLKSTIESLER
jgi:hypothetical protein